MGFDSIRFAGYRNLENGEVDLSSDRIFLIGENGQGKSNFLEALYLVCTGASFRTRVDRHLIRHGESGAVVEAGSRSEGVSRSVTVRLSAAGKREIREDGSPVRDRKRLIESNPCILFAHGDMQYVDGPPDRRRWFFNQTLSLFDPDYIDLLRQYRRVLAARNASLKDRRYELLDTYDSHLASLGVRIQRRRMGEIERFSGVLAPLFRTIAGVDGDLRARCRPSWGEIEDPEEVRKLLLERRERDKMRETTTSGPQRDRILFLLEGKDFSHYASTGQVRLTALILKVAQARSFYERTGRRPILLLDDVLLELDAARREAFLSSLPEYDQAFFTFLPNEAFTRYADSETRIYVVEGGALSGWKEQEIY